MRILLEISKFTLRMVYFFIKIFPTQNKVLFLSRQSDTPSIDFKLLRNEIKEQNSNIKIAMLTKTLGKGILDKLGYAFHMWRQMYHLATSRVVIIDGYQIVVSLLKHKSSLKVIQIWHALGSLKKFGYSIMDKNEGSKREIIESMNMHKNYDVVIASGEIARKNYAEAFNTDIKKIKVMSLPRVDFLLDEKYISQTKQRIFETYPILDNGKKTILYVPTFRKTGEVESEKVLNSIDLNKYNLVIAMHSGIQSIYTDNTSNVLKGNNFTGLELLHIANYVITDYSAITFEAAVAGKPIFFYTYDIDSYKDNRDMYIDFEKEIPGIYSKDIDDIYEAIENKKYDLAKVKAFAEKYVENMDINNTKKLAQMVLEKMGGKV